MSTVDKTRVNKTVVFRTPIEGDNILVRTGTMSDGSCFFHSVLYAISDEYAQTSDSERKKLVQELRMDIADNLTIEQWETLGNGTIFKVLLTEQILNTIKSLLMFFQHDIKPKSKISKSIIIDNVKSEKIMSGYRIISELMTMNDFQMAVESFENEVDSKHCTKSFIKVLVNILLNKTEIRNTPEKQQQIFSNLLEKLLKSLCSHVIKHTFNNYKQDLADPNSFTDLFTIQLIADHIDRDIYVIDANTREPYKTGLIPKERDSIILLWINNDHYEIIGKLLPGNEVQREFEYTDDIITSLQ